jgi:hypothetical protein
MSEPQLASIHHPQAEVPTGIIRDHVCVRWTGDFPQSEQAGRLVNCGEHALEKLPFNGEYNDVISFVHWPWCR